MVYFRVMSNGHTDFGLNGEGNKDTLWRKLSDPLREYIIGELQKEIETGFNNPGKIIRIYPEKIKDNISGYWPYFLIKDNPLDILKDAVKNGNTIFKNGGADKKVFKYKQVYKEIAINYISRLENNNNTLSKKLIEFLKEDNNKEIFGKKLLELFGIKDINIKRDNENDANQEKVYKFLNNKNQLKFNVILTNPFSKTKIDKSKAIYNANSNNQYYRIINGFTQFFNILAINPIGADDETFKQKREAYYSQIRNRLFGGLMEYYRASIRILQKQINDLCFKYSLSEERLCEKSQKENNSNRENKKENKKRVNKKRGKDKKPLLNSNETEIVVKKEPTTIAGKFREMLQKAQDEGDDKKVQKLLDFYETHKDVINASINQ